MIVLYFLFFIVNLTAHHLNYPIKFGYINKIDKWWPQNQLLSGLGVPGYAQPSSYNFLAFSFWTTNKGSMDAAAVWGDPLKYLSSRNQFGVFNSLIHKKIKQRYKSKGIKIVVSAFGDSNFPTTDKVDPIKCASELASFVSDNLLDGVDIDWQDTQALEKGTGQQWLIDFTKKLRQLLPDSIISHAPQAPYFDESIFKSGGYMKVHRQVGHMIDFYNVQFYNQMSLSYDTYDFLFKRSNRIGNSLGTSVGQLMKRGIPSHKIVIGKPATESDAYNTGYIKPLTLSYMLLRANRQFGWYAGVMFWQYSSDKKGLAALFSTYQLTLFYRRNPIQPKHQPYFRTKEPEKQDNPKKNYEPNQNTIKKENKTSTIKTVSKQTLEKQKQKCRYPYCVQQKTQIIYPEKKQIISENFETDNQNKINLKLQYPIKMVYIERIRGWWPASEVLKALAVPGYAQETLYNVIALSIWTSNRGTVGPAKVWENPLKFIASKTQFGKNNDEIKKNLIKKYHSKGIKVLVSVFGTSNMPTTSKEDPETAAKNLSIFVKNNLLDGVHIFWKDHRALINGIGQNWLISFTKALRSLLSDKIISHSPQAPYFDEEKYKNGGYMNVHKKVGNLIDFYSVQFFNQMSLRYDTYETLFVKSDPSTKLIGTSVSELMKKGIPKSKIIVSKPATQNDVQNTGWMEPKQLGTAVITAYYKLGWYGGVMFWEYDSDLKGQAIRQSTLTLNSICKTNNKCKI